MAQIMDNCLPKLNKTWNKAFCVYKNEYKKTYACSWILIHIKVEQMC